jgi:hypothetical protein
MFYNFCKGKTAAQFLLASLYSDHGDEPAGVTLGNIRAWNSGFVYDDFCDMVL